MNDLIKDARSGTNSQNLQEILDAAVSGAQALQGGQQQYQTPTWLARACSRLLPFINGPEAYDPQCAAGNLLLSLSSYRRYGGDVDNRFTEDGAINRIYGNCVKVWETFKDLYPDDNDGFAHIVANPPFGIRWKVNNLLGEEESMDSSAWTWKLITERLRKGGCGYFISNANTIERLKINEHPWVYLYQRFPGGGIWDNCEVELGIVHFYNNELPHQWADKVQLGRVDKVWGHVPEEFEVASLRTQLKFPVHICTPPYGSQMQDWKWEQVKKIVIEESGRHSKWNIWLNKEGLLRTYLSTRLSMKLSNEDIQLLSGLNGCHPLTLTTERERRKVLQQVLVAGIYTIEPEAREAIQSALEEVATISCPIRPVNDFALVAYADEEDTLVCISSDPSHAMALTVGKHYEISTGTYSFAEKYTRKKLHCDEETGETELEEHDCELHGQDRYIQVIDDRGHIHKFMDKPRIQGQEHPESRLWELFKKPYVPSIKEVQSDDYNRNLEIMRVNELMNSFVYFPGQLDYYARMACKDYGLIAADVGCHAKGTLILMADGRRKPVEDVLPGERIMGWDNTARRVLRLSRGRQEMVRIVPTKGEPFVVNMDHILTLVQTNVHHSRKLAITNGTVRDVTVREYLSWPKEWRDNHKLFRRGIELAERDVLFSPYFMGVYLGDGSCSHDDIQVGITKPDPEIRAAVRAECRERGWQMRTAERSPGNPTHFIKGGAVKQWLKVLGLFKLGSGERFIPDRYLRNSRKVRLSVLAGLLDTDGHLDRCGTFDYISQSRRLADDVAWLARSLGLAAYVSPCEKRDQHGNGGTYFRVCISGDLDMIPTRIPRKQAKPRTQKKDVLRTGFNVEALPEDDFYGFSIEGDGRFLLGDFTVTHNTGKTLGALTMVALKSPKRTLIIAPQGTMRSSGDEEDAEEYQASQWVQEIRRFAPTEPVFQLFNPDDWANILRANGGVLPNGVFITYPQAIFSNGAFESCPATWNDAETERKFCKHFDLPFSEERRMEDFFSLGVGHEKNGIRCIGSPSLYTQMAASHGHDLWDMVIVDEAHLMCNIEARITKNLLRVQPKYRFAMTATPIPNLVTNIFSLMGWLCVPNWFKGELRNAAWPYAVNEGGRFANTFLSTEIDKTAQAKARAKGKKNPRCARSSPIISAPARLLKLLAPTMAYISKEDCNPNLMPCEVIDVRVKLGRQQSVLYAHWMNRMNYVPEFKNALTVAMVQSSRLRGVCTAPASLPYTLKKCHSNFNPKTVTILGLIRDCLRRGEQAVVVSARVSQSEEIASRLVDAGIPVARIDSTIPAELHTAEANRFKRGDARVMLMGIKCAQGHSFDQCPNLIIGSLEWSYGTLHQAKGRVWRLTSKKPVKVWCVLHKGTIEELLFDRVAMKQDAATICLRGKRVPRDFKEMDASEVLAEHIATFDETAADVMSEVECETEWPELRRQLTLSVHEKNRISEAA